MGILSRILGKPKESGNSQYERATGAVDTRQSANDAKWAAATEGKAVPPMMTRAEKTKRKWATKAAGAVSGIAKSAAPYIKNAAQNAASNSQPGKSGGYDIMGGKDLIGGGSFGPSRQKGKKGRQKGKKGLQRQPRPSRQLRPFDKEKGGNDDYDPLGFNGNRDLVGSFGPSRQKGKKGKEKGGNDDYDPLGMI